MQAGKQLFEFHGTAGEYFKIWIVNTLLSIISLGLYSPWAKVRNKRYFYNNTLLMNTPFDYLADPHKILKGRLLALGIILIYSLFSMLSPVFEGLLFLVFLFMLPWIIIQALKFNLYNSAYRNIRFYFDSDYLTAFKIFILFPILIPLTLGLAYPAFVRARKKFVIDHSAYGVNTFSMSASLGQIYAVYLFAAGMVLLAGLLLMTVSYLEQGLFLSLGASAGLITSPISVFILMLFGIAIYGFIYTATSNLFINQTQLRQFRFESSLKTPIICWIYITNALAIIFSFGLLIPWAMIRSTRYRLSCLSLICSDDPDAFIAQEKEQTEALGQELDDLLDLDIGL